MYLYICIYYHKFFIFKNLFGAFGDALAFQVIRYISMDLFIYVYITADFLCWKCLSVTIAEWLSIFSQLYLEGVQECMRERVREYERALNLSYA